MRNLLLIPIAGLFLLSACNTARKPSAANFTTAINQYLAKHGQACALIGRQFPVDVPRSVPGGRTRKTRRPRCQLPVHSPRHHWPPHGTDAHTDVDENVEHSAIAQTRDVAEAKYASNEIVIAFFRSLDICLLKCPCGEMSPPDRLLAADHLNPRGWQFGKECTPDGECLSTGNETQERIASRDHGARR
jgi:hypothetical protein